MNRTVVDSFIMRLFMVQMLMAMIRINEGADQAWFLYLIWGEVIFTAILDMALCWYYRD